MKKLALLLFSVIFVFTLVSVSVNAEESSDIFDYVYNDNYDLVVEQADGLNLVRFAKGENLTGSQIKNAEGMVSLNQRIIDANIKDNIFRYSLPDGGVYSVFLRYDSGMEKVVCINTTNMKPKISLDGLNLTVDGLYGVDDFFIARGNGTTKSYCQNNLVVHVTQNKIQGAKNYKYTLPYVEDGEFTIFFRYLDGFRTDGVSSLYINNESASEGLIAGFQEHIDRPTLSIFGLTLNITNMKNVKTIRMAPGTWNSNSEIKSAPGYIGYSVNAIAKQDPTLSSYSIKYSEKKTGPWTCIVLLNNGYAEILQYDVEKNVPGIGFDCNSIYISNLEGIDIIRWAPGNTTKPKDVPGNKYVKAKDIDTDDIFTIDDLTNQWSFLIQYVDGSQTILTHTFDSTKGLSVAELKGVLAESNIGDIIKFGRYEQDNDLTNGRENIEWQILKKESGKVLVISKYALDCQPYNTEVGEEGITWADSSLRYWLNNSFINNAFTTDQQKCIFTTDLINSGNSYYYGTVGGQSTSDKIFLLNTIDAYTYFSYDFNRQCIPTQYAISQGSYTDNGNTWWWLRNPGASQDYATIVVSGGGVSNLGYKIDGDGYISVRPAMWISLNYSDSGDADDPTTDDNQNTNCFSEAQVGDTITFGKYEQDNYLTNGKEKIEWKVLAKESDKILVISKYGLDVKAYNTAIEDVTWETCLLRDWLNNTFIDDAFTTDEQKIIVTSDVVNDDNSKYNTIGGKATSDQLFLLSLSEAETYFNSDSERLCIPTPYALSNGASEYEGLGWWWLRSPGDVNKSAIVDLYGIVDYKGMKINTSDNCVRPAMWISISSEDPGTNVGWHSYNFEDAKVGDTVLLGEYEQDNNLSNGKEKIEWIVLEKMSFDKMLLISKYALDLQQFSNNYKDVVTWETSSLRYWLNNTFIDVAFDTFEKDGIRLSSVTNENGGNTTQDQIFSLSVYEAQYYFSSDEERICTPTQHVLSQVSDVDDCYWWLRSPSEYENTNTAIVESDGNINDVGACVINDDGLVRPVMWIDLSYFF